MCGDFELRKAFGLVCKDCYNKILQTGWLKQQKFIFIQFWRLKVQDQGISVFGSSEDSLFDLKMAAFSMCVLTWSSLCVCLGLEIFL